MHANPMLAPTLALTACLFYAGLRLEAVATSKAARSAMWVGATLLAIPGCTFVLYYTHLFDSALWLMTLRAWPFTELLSSGVGLLLGALHSAFSPDTVGEKLIAAAVALICVTTIFAKPLLAPIDLEKLNNSCEGPICMQTTFSTCGPASAATILKSFGAQASERALAEEAYTYRGGTEAWYLARALRRRGFDVQFVSQKKPITDLPTPSIAGVILPGGSGHFIAVLHGNGRELIIADPLRGRAILDRPQAIKAYTFTGFFMVVQPRRPVFRTQS